MTVYGQCELYALSLINRNCVFLQSVSQKSFMQIWSFGIAPKFESDPDTDQWCNGSREKVNKLHNKLEQAATCFYCSVKHHYCFRSIKAWERCLSVCLCQPHPCMLMHKCVGDGTQEHVSTGCMTWHLHICIQLQMSVKSAGCTVFVLSSFLLVRDKESL